MMSQIVSPAVLILSLMFAKEMAIAKVTMAMGRDLRQRMYAEPVKAQSGRLKRRASSSRGPSPRNTRVVRSSTIQELVRHQPESARKEVSGSPGPRRSDQVKRGEPVRQPKSAG